MLHKGKVMDVKVIYSQDGCGFMEEVTVTYLNKHPSTHKSVFCYSSTVIDKSAILSPLLSLSDSLSHTHL